MEHDPQNPHKNLVTLGMVGYPNVGKSSVINVLCKKKLVGVAARPGKTKHFQTIFIEKDLLLCDCPGLVFPSCASTKPEMVCNGVLPIDNLKDYISPIEILASKIHKSIFEKLYHIKIDIEKPNASQILSAFAIQRGFYTGGSGLPDHAKVSKIILKDLVNGKLLMCKLSPEYSEEKHGKIYISNEFLEKEIEEHLLAVKKERENAKEQFGEGEEENKKDIDDDFDLMNQTADEKVTSFEKNEPQINSYPRRDYSIKLQSTQPEIISQSIKKPELENSFFDVNGPDKSYIDDDFNNNIESPKFTSSQQVSIEFAKSNINPSIKDSMTENKSNNKKSPVNNKQLDKTTDSWAVANDDPNESVDLLLPASITSKLLEKPEFLSNKRIGRPRM